MKKFSTQQEPFSIEVNTHDERWIAYLMRTYYQELFNYGTKFTRDEEVIKDCIQEVFISLWQRRHTSNEILCPKFYFLRAVKNKILKALDCSRRRQNRDLGSENYDFFHEFSIEKIIISKETSVENFSKLKSILSNLSKREKEIIYLKYYQYLENAQIAELMNISRQSVYNLIHGSILKLRMLWHKEFVGQH